MSLVYANTASYNQICYGIILLFNSNTEYDIRKLWGSGEIYLRTTLTLTFGCHAFVPDKRESADHDCLAFYLKGHKRTGLTGVWFINTIFTTCFKTESKSYFCGQIMYCIRWRMIHVCMRTDEARHRLCQRVTSTELHQQLILGSGFGQSFVFALPEPSWKKL